MTSLPNLKNSSNQIGNEQESDGLGEFVGAQEFHRQFNETLKLFKKWNENEDWLAFHHHHYDWWMFPIDEISSRGRQFQLTPEFRNELRQDDEFIFNLRQGVQWMVKSWGWDIVRGAYFPKRSDNQKWSHWPVRLYKAGRSMWLFGQNDYYQSLRKLAENIKLSGEKLDYYSHTKQGKADVFQQWDEMEKTI